MTDFFEPILFLYGPPGSGKTSTGRHLARALNLPFIDLDQEITLQAKLSIPDIFARENESGFRKRESAALNDAITRGPAVIALGGGALLDPLNRAAAGQYGVVLCLTASRAELAERVRKLEGTRPLLGKAAELENHLEALLAARADHYASFPEQFDTQALSPEQSAWEIQMRLGMFFVTGMGSGYDVRVMPNSLARLGDFMRTRQMAGPVALVSDEHVGPLHADRAARSLNEAGYSVVRIGLPAGEVSKSLSSAAHHVGRILAGGLERGSTVVALGGGVVADLAGYAASAFLRGVRWVSVPTSLLA